MKRLSTILESAWPYLLSEGYDVTSPKTPIYDTSCIKYNCIAFAADVDTAWWEPDDAGSGMWPISKREYTLECYTEAYESVGYSICDKSDKEEGFEKIALYTLRGEPTHAAKQLPDGRWKSKLGYEEDIEHNTIKALEDNNCYGVATRFMKRPV